jgi:hypothetical protein
MHQHRPLQNTQKFTQNWNFWFENIPSGNPAEDKRCAQQRLVVKIVQ